MAVQDYELLLKVRADLMQAVSGMKGLTDSIGGAKAAADSVGESSDQAATRIQKMVQATSSQAKIQESARSQAERAAETARSTIADYDAQAAAIKRASDATARYRDNMAGKAGGQSSAGAIAAQRAEMAKLAQQIDPTVAALSKLDAQERSLNQLRKAGAVGIDDYQRFKGVIDQNRIAITGAAGAMHKFSLNTSQSRIELGRLIKDAATGQYGRLGQTSMTLAAQTGAMSLLFNPLGLAIGAVVGSLGAFALAAAKVSSENDKLNKSIAATGNFAGTTTGEIDQLASSITATNGSISDSRDILGTLVASGRVGSRALGSLGQAAVDMAALTGESADKAAASVLKMFDGTAASAVKANEQYHFLTTAIYDQIKALEDEGNTQAAMDVAAEAFHQSAMQRIAQMNQQLSGMAKMWEKVKHSAGGAWERMKTGASVVLGSADDQTKLYNMLGKKEEAKQGGLSGFGSALNMVLGDGIVKKIPGGAASWTAADEAKLQAQQAKVDKDQQSAADAETRANLNDAAVSADAGLTRLASSIDKAYAKKEKIKELNKYFNDLWAGADPGNSKLAGVQRNVNADGSVGFSGGLYDKLLANIEKGHTITPRVSKGTSDTAAVAAQQALIKALGDEQGKLDPVAKAWATYNDQVTKANELADKAKLAKGANVQGIDAERTALVKMYATARDASLSDIAKKDREAFEKLRDSLKDVDGVSLGNIRAQLKQLADERARGTISNSEYNSTKESALNQSIKPLPAFKGVDAVVGGPFSELNKIEEQTKQLEAAYKAQLDLLNKQHEAKLRSDESFNAKELELTQAHAASVQQIEDARSQVMLAGITSSLASGAEAIKQGFGAQSAVYRAAFAVSKAAAIAEASVSMFKNIAKATEWGWPENIPLIAQATGEGLTIIGGLRSISAGYSEGGYTGPGAKHQPAGVVHAGEGVLNQQEIGDLGGPAGFYKLREAIKSGAFSSRGLAGYASGGMVTSPMASTAGFASRREPNYAMRENAAASGQGSGARIRIVNTPDPEMMRDWATSSEGEQVILNMLGKNRTTLKTLVSH